MSAAALEVSTASYLAQISVLSDRILGSLHFWLLAMRDWHSWERWFLRWSSRVGEINKQTNLSAVTSFLRQRYVPLCFSSVSALHLVLCWLALWQVSDFLQHSYHQLSFNIQAMKYTTQVIPACYEAVRPCRLANDKLFDNLYDREGWDTLPEDTKV